jgi:membrane protease YdiL (CAAX protease family)
LLLCAAYGFPMLSEKRWEPTLVLMLGALIALSFAGAMLTAGIVHALAKPHLSLDNLALVTLIIMVLGFQGGVPIWVHFFLKRHHVTWGEAFGFARGNTARCIMLAVIALPFVWAGTLGLSKGSELGLNALHEWLQWKWLKPELQSVVQLLQHDWPLHLVIVQGVITIVVAPLGEEILFRGIFYTAIKQRGRPQAALWASAMLFALIHLSPVNLLSLLFLGMVFVWMYERTQNLLAPILLHALFNTMNFLLIVTHPRWAEEVLKP